MVFGLAAYGEDAVSTETPEVSVIRRNSGQSGNVFITIAERLGYFEEYGLKIEPVHATAIADAMALLATNQVDVVSNSGTSNPLQQIAAGVDLTIWGGHMVTGAMPVIARKGTVWNGPQDLIGKRFACNPVYYAFTGAVMELGYDNPLEVVDWVVYTSYHDAMAAVVRGEVDYALQGTGNNHIAKTMDEIEIIFYHRDIMPNYSCCRLVSRTEFFENNPVAFKLLTKALIRAQQYYEANKEEVAVWQAERMGVDEEYVAAYMFEDAYVIGADPLKNPVVRAWDILDKTGFLNENARSINILNHINTEVYEAALNEVIAEYGHEDPEFYDKLLAFYKENNL